MKSEIDSAITVLATRASKALEPLAAAQLAQAALSLAQAQASCRS
jgi:hypothetical protein